MMHIVPKKPAPDAPFKHVIAEYRHRTETVTCECGWQGSTATVHTQTSDWNLHLAANRTAKPR